MDRGFLFETSNGKIKSHGVEIQITFGYVYHLQKNNAINHLIIVNNLISKSYQCSIRGFCRSISMFLVSASAKKNPAVRQFNSYES